MDMLAPQDVGQPIIDRLPGALDAAEELFKGSIREAVADVAATVKTHYPQVDFACVSAGPKDGTTQELFSKYQEAA